MLKSLRSLVLGGKTPSMFMLGIIIFPYDERGPNRLNKFRNSGCKGFPEGQYTDVIVI